MRKGIAVAALLLAGVLSLRAGNRTLCTGFLPENDMKIPVGDVNALGITEAEFNSVLDKVQAIYAPIIAAKGGKLSVNRKWSDPTVNASANQSMGTWHINMYGGLARHAAITRGGFALVACHEIGHHIAGFPKMRGWATNEGGSDYFATLKCLRQFFKSDGATDPVDPIAAASCDATYSGDDDRRLCKSGAMAGASVAALFQSMRPAPKAPAFDTPDPAVVERTNNAHPAAQCRLDTYYQGALCTKGVPEELSDSTPVPGACTASQGFAKGLRPNCWYKAPAGSAAPALASRIDGKAVEGRIESLAGLLSSHGL